MLVTERLRFSIAKRKETEHPFRSDEGNGQPGTQMGKTRESPPFNFLACVPNQETSVGCEYLPQESAVAGFKGSRRLREPTARFAVLNFAGEKEAIVCLNQEDLR